MAARAGHAPEVLPGRHLPELPADLLPDAPLLRLPGVAVRRIHIIPCACHLMSGQTSRAVAKRPAAVQCADLGRPNAARKHAKRNSYPLQLPWQKDHLPGSP